MKKRRIALREFLWLILLATLLIVYRRCAPLYGSQMQQGSLFDSSQLIAKRDSFNLLYKGQVDGSMVLSTSHQPDAFVLEVTTEWLSQDILETELITLDKTNFQVKSVKVGGHFGPEIIDYRFEWKNGAIAVEIKNQAGGVPSAKMEHQLEAVTYERSSMILALIQALPLKEGYVFGQKSLMTLDNTVLDTEVRVLGSEKISLNLGSFDTFKVQFTSPSVTNIIYITKSTPHIAVKYESVGFPISFELVKSHKVGPPR